MIMRVKVTPKTLENTKQETPPQNMSQELPEKAFPLAPQEMQGRLPGHEPCLLLEFIFPTAEAREAKPPPMAQEWDGDWKEEIPGPSSLSSQHTSGVGAHMCNTCVVCGSPYPLPQQK